jgi:hypothetical protein
MSLCINHDLIWVSVPRCASKSIELSLLKSDLKINHYVHGLTSEVEKHAHIPITNWDIGVILFTKVD